MLKLIIIPSLTLLLSFGCFEYGKIAGYKEARGYIRCKNQKIEVGNIDFENVILDDIKCDPDAQT